jgi:hypothetical protein
VRRDRQKDAYATVSIYAGTGDSIWMDGQFLRKSPLQQKVLSPGSHEFTLKTAGGESYSTSLSLEAGDRVVLRWDSATGMVSRVER